MNAQKNLTLLIIVTVLGVVGVFVYNAFGEVATLVYVVVVGVSAIIYTAILTGQMMALAASRSALNAIVDFQAADDRGEVARARMLTEVVRHSGRIATEDARHERRQQPQLPAPDVWTIDAPPPRMLTARDDAEVAYE